MINCFMCPLIMSDSYKKQHTIILCCAENSHSIFHFYSALIDIAILLSSVKFNLRSIVDG